MCPVGAPDLFCVGGVIRPAKVGIKLGRSSHLTRPVSSSHVLGVYEFLRGAKCRRKRKKFCTAIKRRACTITLGASKTIAIGGAGFFFCTRMSKAHPVLIDEFHFVHVEQAMAAIRTPVHATRQPRRRRRSGVFGSLNPLPGFLSAHRRALCGRRLLAGLNLPFPTLRKVSIEDPRKSIEVS